MYEYIKEQYTNITEDLFKSAFAINATLHIHAEEVGMESFEDLYGDTLDGRNVDFIKKTYPVDLNPFYRIKVYPMEKAGLRLSGEQQFEYKPAAHVEPFDMWISVLEEAVRIREDNNLFDFTDKVDIENNSYEIKGIVKEKFGNKPIVHVFLVKESGK